MRMSITSLILGSLLVLGFAAHAQTPQPEHQQTPAKPSADMAAKCKAMMTEHEKMMAEMKAADQRRRSTADPTFGGRPFVIAAVLMFLHLFNSPWLSQF